ncbi:MAG: PorT family protein [Prevotella sp.]|nr:PorT family protein [Prevotella sp.]
MRHYLLLLLLALPLCISAQVGDHRNELAVGFNGGYMMSQVAFTPKVQQKQLGGLTGGLTLRYTCEKYFSSICAIVGELNYAQTGWNEDIRTVDDEPVLNAAGEALSYQRRMSYVQLPVLARLGWGRERRGFQGFFQVGPQIGWFLSESTSKNFSLGDATQNERASKIVAQDTMAVENKFDYGIAVGAGLEYSIPNAGHLLLEARYYYGLGNIYGNTKSDYFGKSNFGSIIVKVSYLFDIIRSKNPKIK